MTKNKKVKVEIFRSIEDLKRTGSKPSVNLKKSELNRRNKNWLDLTKYIASLRKD